MSSALEQSQALFIRRWGEMGNYWGISRTMAEIHALLYISEEPLCTDDIMERLQISRGNASVNLRKLLDWGLIERVHKPGDRREYFVSEKDVWQMFETITRQRKRREVEPIIDTILRCREMIAGHLSPGSPQRRQAELYRRRLNNMLEFLNTMNQLSELILRVGRKGTRALLTTLRKMA